MPSILQQMVEVEVNFKHVLTIFSFYAVLFFIKRLFLTNSTSNKNLPPSPSKLPIIGNLHQLGLHPHRILQRLAGRHGPLMLLHLGSKPAVVVSSADAAQEVLKTHDIIFSNRPDSRIARKLMYDGKDFFLAPYGEYWRQMRSICVMQLLSTKRVQSFRFIREQETALFVEKIRQSCSSALDLSKAFNLLSNDITCRIAFGKKYAEEEGGKNFQKLMEEMGDLLGAFNVEDFIPWLAWVNNLTGLNTKVELVFKQFDNFLEGVIDDHMSHSNALANGVVKEDHTDLVDVLLQAQKNSSGTDGGSNFGRDSIKAVILDMFGAGTETTSTTLEWTMTEIMRHPITLKRLQNEVRDIAGKKDNITEDDLGKMNYLQAVIKETLRLHPPLPILVPRSPSQDVEVQGYDILAETRVLINAWAIARDPAYWDEPEKFNPERFLGSSIDFRGHDFQFLPFGAGRRGCPGISFAIVIVELALANLLYKFDWSLPGGAKGQDLDVTESTGVAVHRKFPLLVIPTPHSA